MAVPLSVAEKIYTAEEFMTLSLDPGKRYELVRGVIKAMSHPGEEHMLITSNLFRVLSNFTYTNKLGWVLPPGSFELKIEGTTRDTVRSPDLAYLAKEKITGQSGAVIVPPDLAIEVYSPTDRPGDLTEKLEDYQAAGWDLVWVIYPPTATPKRKAGTVEIYRLQAETGLQPAKTLKQNDPLSDELVLPGFNIPVAALFDYDQ